MKISAQAVFAIGLFVAGILLGMAIDKKPPPNDYSQPNLVISQIKECPVCEVCEKCQACEPAPKPQRGVPPSYVKELAEACAEMRITRYGCN